MSPPITAVEHLQFISTMQRIRISISNLAKIVSPLQDAMKLFYFHTVKRRKRSVQYVRLTAINWLQQEQQLFQTCKHVLIHRVTLSHRDDSKRFCSYVDASDLHWSGIVTQAPADYVFLNHDEKRHEPLVFFPEASLKLHCVRQLSRRKYSVSRQQSNACTGLL